MGKIMAPVQQEVGCFLRSGQRLGAWKRWGSSSSHPLDLGLLAYGVYGLLRFILRTIIKVYEFIIMIITLLSLLIMIINSSVFKEACFGYPVVIYHHLFEWTTWTYVDCTTRSCQPPLSLKTHRVVWSHKVIWLFQHWGVVFFSRLSSFWPPIYCCIQ